MAHVALSRAANATTTTNFISCPCESDTRCLVFLIPGNPGIISYYTDFLHDLAACLDPGRDSCTANPERFIIQGSSLPGFELSGPVDPVVRDEKPPFGLRKQVENVECIIERQCLTCFEDREKAISPSPSNNDTPGAIRLVLIGHSIGAYIMLEVIRRWREQCSVLAQNPGLRVEIVGGIALFPTIVDIAKSENGRRLSALLRTGLLIPAAWYLSVTAAAFLPQVVVSTLLGYSTAMPQWAADITAAFLRTPSCVHQSLHMARDEMNLVLEDNWDSVIWGSCPVPGGPVSLTSVPLVIYFGQNVSFCWPDV